MMSKSIHTALFFVLSSSSLLLVSLWMSNTYSANLSSHSDNCPQQLFTDTSAHASSLPNIIGEAYTDDNQFLYCEYHYFIGDTQRRVDYRNTKLNLIASKGVDFKESQWAPDISQNDFRHNEKIIVSRQKDNSNTTPQERRFLMKYRKGLPLDSTLDEVTERPQLRQKEVILNEPVVIDAGFDNAIRSRWEELSSQSTTTFIFLVPASLRAIELRVNRLSEVTDCITGRVEMIPYNNTHYVCYRVDPANVLLSWFVPSIQLLYDKASQRLAYFSGATNITNQYAEGQKAQITYYYY